MEFIPQLLKDVWVIEPKIIGDNRGYFTESYKKDIFDKTIGETLFIQDNESKSSYGVFRGMHYQKGDKSQAKLVRCLHGSVIDFIVDLRESSPTFGQSIGVELSEDNHRQLFVPRGFAHGFIVTSPTAVFSYKVDNVYSPEHECCIRFDDPDINIIIPEEITDLKLSDKDRNGLFFKDAPKFV